jgi:hypothetical protein
MGCKHKQASHLLEGGIACCNVALPCCKLIQHALRKGRQGLGQHVTAGDTRAGLRTERRGRQHRQGWQSSHHFIRQ